MSGLNLPSLRFASGPEIPVGTPAENAFELEDSALATSILIVEDEAMIAWMMESLLEDMGFTDIAIAASGEDAIARTRSHPPKLVISDINLGRDRMDGVEAVTAIRQEANLAIVFVSGYASAEARERITRDVPGAYVLRKPINVDELRRAIIDLFDRRRAN